MRTPPNQTDEVQRILLTHLSFSLDPGDRIAIRGANGSGKSCLFNAIAGEHSITEGSITRASHIQYDRAYQIPQWQSGLLRNWLLQMRLDETRFRQILGSFSVRGDIFDRPLETFSLDQLKKVDLARSMMSKVHFLMWDEPLNYIDIISRQQIESAMLDCQPTLLFIEHDQMFTTRVATKIVDLSHFQPPA